MRANLPAGFAGKDMSATASNMVCHSERSEESTAANTQHGRTRGFFAALRMTRVSEFVFFLARLPARALLALVAVYQRTLSPALPALFGPTCGCRFSPTCSHYAADAIRTHGAFFGAGLAARRLVRCTPFSAGGFDPVPAPRCARVNHSAPAASGLAPSA